MINPHQRFGQRLLSLCKQQWSICTHQWDTEQLSNPQGKKSYCPTACWLVLMPLLEPRMHSMGCNSECCARAQRSPSPGSSAHSSLFTVPHRSDQVPSVQTPVTALKVFSSIYLHSGRLEKPPPLPPPSAEHSQETRCAGPRAARYKHTPDPRGSTHSCQRLVQQGTRTNSFYQPLDAFYFLLLLCQALPFNC